MQFLSDEWIAAMSAAIMDVEVPAEIEISVAQIVGDTPRGELRWTLRCSAGRCRISRDDDPVDVTLRSDRDTAFAIATGAMSAGRAVLRGDLTISGDPLRLVAAAPVLDTARIALAIIGTSLDEAEPQRPLP